MSSSWSNNIKHIAPGEPVQAGVVSRPDKVLESRTDYLKERLDAAEAGRALIDAAVTVAPSVLPGQPVYWNSVEQRYERALAAVTLEPTTQNFIAQPTADCVGICLKKHSETLGDVVLRGVVELPELTNAVAGAITAGRYYLSATEAGKLVKQRPAVSSFVCYVLGPKDTCATVPRVVVAPQQKDYVEEHTHYRIDLVTAPAGTATLANGEYTITNPNTALPGWLPANHASFNGKAPAGAVFGYNLPEHVTLQNIWPPIPIQSVSILWDKGADLLGATEVPLGPSGLVVCDVNGIWWMSNCENDVPWPATINAPNETCPRDEVMRISVVFIRMLVGNDRSVVTSLTPGDESPIVLTNCNATAATTGDLNINLNLQTISTTARGGTVLKSVVAGKKLSAGVVAEGVFSLSDQLVLTGTQTRNLTAQEKEEFNLSNDAVLHQGIIKIDYTDLLVEREISPQIIRLSDTVERLYMDIPYLGFPAGQSSLMRLRFNLPDSNLGDNLQMKVRVRFFGRGGTASTPATLPALYMSYRRLAKPETTGTQLLPTDTALNFNSVVSLRIDHATERDSDAFTVAAGDTVLVTIGRAENIADVYPEVGILRVTGIVYSNT